MKPILTTILICSAALAACQTVPPPTDTFCELYQPVEWGPNTPEAQRTLIQQNNAVYQELCV